MFSFSQFELAWTSFKGVCHKYDKSSADKNRIHPTQKPISLYKWILLHYATTGQKIIDTHLGSGSSRIASDQLGFEFWGYEIDADYFNQQERRFAEYKSQLKLAL